MTVEEIVVDVTIRLNQIGIPYVVGGSLASGTWGQMRNTNDADLAIRIAPTDVASLVAAFPDPYYISGQEAQEALIAKGPFRTLQLLHMEESFKIDFFLLADGPYERSELERARSVVSSLGTPIRFSAPENIVLAKLRWYELGNRVSDRQWNDVVQVLEVQKGNLDDEYLDHWAQHFGVESLLQKARQQTFD